MIRVEGDVLLLPGWAYNTLLDAHDMASGYLVGLGHPAWDVDVGLRQATFARTWWSDTAGFAHDCDAHSPTETGEDTCPPDRVQVTVVSNIPPQLLVRSA